MSKYLICYAWIFSGTMHLTVALLAPATIYQWLLIMTSYMCAFYEWRLAQYE